MMSRCEDYRKDWKLVPARDLADASFTAAVGVLGLLFGALIALYAHAADPPQQRTREQRGEMETRAKELFDGGYQRYQRGQIAAALDRVRQVIQIQELLYPKGEYPDGHPDLAESLNAMGFLLKAQGASSEALGYYERALKMRQALYRKEQYPRGHPDLAKSLNEMGVLLNAQGRLRRVQVRGYYEREASAMRQALYSKDKYPQGHPDLAGSSQ